MKKLYVGNLPYTTTEDDLRDYFAKAGVISSVRIIIDKMSGRSKGFGFVEMENDEEAMKAIEEFNGKEWGERKLVVNEARPMEPRNNDRGGRY